MLLARDQGGLCQILWLSAERYRRVGSIPGGGGGEQHVPYPVFVMNLLGPLMTTSSFVCN